MWKRQVRDDGLGRSRVERHEKMFVLACHEQRHGRLGERLPEAAARAVTEQTLVDPTRVRPEHRHGAGIAPGAVGASVQMFARRHPASWRIAHAPQYMRNAEARFVVDFPPWRRDENTGTSSIG